MRRREFMALVAVVAKQDEVASGNVLGSLQLLCRCPSLHHGSDTSQTQGIPLLNIMASSQLSR